MKKERINYLVDSFIDENNKERYFILCAVTTINLNSYKITKFGISVQHPNDKYNEETGKRIAYKKAISNPISVINANNIFSMNNDICEQYLLSYAKYFKEDPSIFLNRYKDLKKKEEREKRKKIEEQKFHEEALRRGYRKYTYNA